MFTAGIIETIEKSNWVSPMVVQEKKKKGEMRICIDLKKLNDAYVHDPFPTPFTDEVLENAGGQEAYSFTDGFSRLKNVPTIFSRIIFAAFKEYIHKFLEVYLDDWTVFGLVKHHVASLRLMLDTCQRHQIALNLKKCTFQVPFGNLLGHVVCKQGLIVDPVKISILLNLEAP
eukprot:PITA_29195